MTPDQKNAALYFAAWRGRPEYNMTEFEESKLVASRVLDIPYEDPDSDRLMVARQFLRTLEILEARTRELTAYQIAKDNAALRHAAAFGCPVPIPRIGYQVY